MGQRAQDIVKSHDEGLGQRALGLPPLPNSKSCIELREMGGSRKRKRIQPRPVVRGRVRAETGKVRVRPVNVSAPNAGLP